MSVHAAAVINAIRPVNGYLELGVYDNATFDKVTCERKCGVDTNGRGTFLGTTDDFFEQNAQRFDVVFIDASHDIQSVLADFNNAVLCCDKAIVLHDLVPTDEQHTDQRYCGDAYKLLYWFWSKFVRVGTLNCDCGLTVIHRKDFIGAEDIPNVSFSEFSAALKHHKLLSLEELLAYASE